MRHLLSAMLAAVVCATLCGFRGLQPTLIWLTTHGPAMWHLLGVRRRPPVSQTSGNVLAELDPEFLESLLRSFGEQCVPGEVPPTASPKALSNHAVPNTAMPPDVEIG